MKIYLDTNVLIDYIIPNPGADKIEKILELVARDKAIEIISSTAITDIFYVVRKYKTSQSAQQSIEDILQIVNVVETTSDNIKTALERRWNDFEDAVQYAVAESNGVDYFITSDKKDFKLDTIPVISPADFVKNVIPQL